MKFPVLALLALALPVFAQKMQTPTGEAPGPWICGTIGVGKQPDGTIKTTALKGIAIKVGENAAVAYDLDLCRMVGAWTGKFVTPMNLMSRGEYPTAMGEVLFTTGEVPGFLSGDQKSPAPEKKSGSEPLKSPSEPLFNPREGQKSPAEPLKSPATGDFNPSEGLLSRPPGEKSPGEPQKSAVEGEKSSPAPLSSLGQGEWRDPRPEPFGPLPPGHAKFKGFYVHGEKVILKWDVGGTEVLEMPRHDPDCNVFMRTFLIHPSDTVIRIVLGKAAGVSAISQDVDGPMFFRLAGEPHEVSGVCSFLPASARLEEIEGGLALQIPARKVGWAVTITFAPPGIGGIPYHANSDASKSDFENLLRGGPPRWPEPVVTQGELSKDTDSAYLVDTIKLPDPNPWGAPMFLGGFDFFPDGRAAVCTFHGDVFIVSGLDEKLESVTWRRFASGLYHALGLKIVNGEIYVTGRDGITRLRDLNGDGEADFYEAFNHDVMVTKNFHEFVFDLHTDAQGNFYFAKAGPVKNGGRGFDQIVAHHGSLLRVSPDGSKLDRIATGFRAPNGIGVGPRGELTSGDNEGTWTPTCKINWIKPGGFYGVVDLAHRDSPPADYDRPLCWLPKRVDNSGGAQVWVTSDKWGPWKDQLLHLSYGQCALFGVMREDVPQSAISNQQSAIVQGGVAQFPLKFQSGIMRARFNPVDGQLYVCGLRGWQTSGIRNGAFQRVRYTGAPVRMPIGLRAKKDGIELTFTTDLDTQAAADPENYNVEVWNYVWSSAYGSPEVSTIDAAETPAEAGKAGGPAEFSRAQISRAKHDPLTVKSVSVSTDERTVFLEIPGLKPVMQMAIKYTLKSADGTDMKGEVVNTIHALGE